jgi:hypothetical protein
MTEYFRRLIIKFFLNKQLINATLATSLINWKHSGFSIDHSIRIPAFSIKAREALSQYIARPPISLKKLVFQQIGDDTLILYTPDNELFNGKIKAFTALQFMAEATQHILPRGAQYIRRYGLYASPSLLLHSFFPSHSSYRANGRTNPMWSGSPLRGGRRNTCKLLIRCKPTLKNLPGLSLTRTADLHGPSSLPRCTRATRPGAPLECPRCGSPMRILAVITEPEEVPNDPEQPSVVCHLVKIGRSPPGFDPASSN